MVQCVNVKGGAKTTCTSDFISTGLLYFHANYLVVNRAESQVAEISMMFDLSYSGIYHLSGF